MSDKEQCDQCGAEREDWQDPDDRRCPNHALPAPYSSCDGVLRPVREPGAAIKVKNAPAGPPVTLSDWYRLHNAHGRQWYDVKIGEYHVHRCSCGEKAFVTEAARVGSSDPKLAATKSS